MSLSIDVVRRAVALALVGLALTGAAEAQAPVVVSGRVVDSTGGVVPGASVTVRRQSGQVLASAHTNAEGRFEAACPADGPAVVSAVLDGFSLAQTDVVLGGRPVAVELMLRPGNLSEDLTVIGARLVGSEEMLRRVPGSFNFLSGDVLAASHVFSTSEALRKIPGVSVRDEEGLGLRPNIGMRGLNPTRSSKVLLLEDGVPVAFAPYGDNASYYHPPIERFDRVEVLKGASQVVHGPVTVGGVINYITPEAPAETSGTLAVTGGNRSYVNAAGSIGATMGRTGLFVQAAQKTSDGARENINSDLTDVMVKVSRPFGATQHLTVKTSFYRENSQVTYSGLREAEYAANPRQNPFANDGFDGDRQGFAGAYRALLFSRVAFTGTVYASRFSRDWWRQSSNSAQRPNDSADPACGGMANLGTTCGNEGRLRRYWHLGGEARGRVAFTAGFAQETDFGFRLHTEDQKRRQVNGASPLARTGTLVEHNLRGTEAASTFVQHRAMAGAWTVTPGVRIERIAYSRTNQLAGVSGETRLTEVVPGLGVSYAVATETTLFGGVHKGFAPPRAEDIISNTTGGVVDLDPERSWNYEVGGRTRPTQAVSLDATFFRMDYENQIVPASLAGGVGAALTNGGQTLQQGVEAGADLNWRDIARSRHGVYSRLAYTWLPVARFEGRRTSAISGFTTVSVSGNRLPYASEHTGALTLGYRHAAGLDVQVEAQFLGDQFSDDLNSVAPSADGQRGLIPRYTYWNAAASWRLPRSGSIFVAVKNVADRTFIVDRVRGILPGSPRLVHVGTSWRF
ncbi:MAG: TonB-dependent receptor [Vicinamibacterales bacterium]